MFRASGRFVPEARLKIGLDLRNGGTELVAEPPAVMVEPVSMARLLRDELRFVRLVLAAP
jgi:hypothetical protein